MLVIVIVISDRKIMSKTMNKIPRKNFRVSDPKKVRMGFYSIGSKVSFLKGNNKQ